MDINQRINATRNRLKKSHSIFQQISQDLQVFSFEESKAKAFSANREWIEEKLSTLTKSPNVQLAITDYLENIESKSVVAPPKFASVSQLSSLLETFSNLQREIESIDLYRTEIQSLSTVVGTEITDLGDQIRAEKRLNEVEISNENNKTRINR